MARTIFANLPDGLNPLKLLDTTFADCASLATNNVFSGTNQFGTGYAARLLNVGSGFVAAQPYMVNFGDNQAPAGSRAIFFGFDDFTRPANGLWYNMAIHNVANGGFAIPAGGTLGVWASVVDIGIDNTPAPANISYGHWFKHTVAKGTGAGGGAVLIQAFGAVGFTPSALGTANSGVLGLQCNAWSDVGGYSFAGVFGVITTVSGSQNVGIEVDNDIRASTAGDQIGIQVVSQNGSGVGTPTVAGANIGYYLVKTSGPGYNNAFQIGASDGTGFPLLTTGTIIKAFSASTITAGVDISSLTITGSAFKSPGFSVSGVGAILAVGKVGIGTETNPQQLLVVSGNAATGLAGSTGAPQIRCIGSDGANAALELLAYTNSAAAVSITANFFLTTAGGTGASPSNVKATQTIGQFGARGWTSAAAFTGSTALVYMAAAEDFTGIATGTYVGIATTPIGSVTRADAVRVHNSSGVAIGTTAVATDPGAGNLLVQGVYKSSVAPTAVAGAGPIAIGSASTINSRMKVNLNGTDYWIACSTAAF